MALCKGYPNTETKYTNEGTLAHKVGQWLLDAYVFNIRNHISQNLHGKMHVGRTYDDGGVLINGNITEEICEFVDVYFRNVVAAYEALPENSELLVECELDLSGVYGFPDQIGTADAVLLSACGKEIQIHDLKYGMTPVSAWENEQMMIYALGALEENELWGAPFETVKLVIHQPRLSSIPDEYMISAEELYKWRDELVRPAARTVVKLFEKTPSVQMLNDNIHPGETQCKWCKHKTRCEPLEELVIESIADDFSADDDEAVKLGKKLERLALIRDWANAVEQEAYSRLMSEQPVAGFKLVEGRAGNRTWSDPELAQTLLVDYLEDNAFEKKLITPAKAEKLFKKGNVPEEIHQIIFRPRGSLAMVSNSDPRPAASPVSGDFEADDIL